MNPVINKKNEKQPDYQGWVKLEGKFYEIASWVKFGKTNNKFLSISIREKTHSKMSKIKQSKNPKNCFCLIFALLMMKL